MEEMIEDIQNEIVEQLEKIEDVPTVSAWQGDINDLLKTPQKLPALRVIFQEALFDEKNTIGGDQPALTLNYLVVLVGKNLRRRDAGGEACYPIIGKTLGALTGHNVPGYDYLWPRRVDLIFAEGGILAYGMTFSMYTIWQK